MSVEPITSKKVSNDTIFDFFNIQDYALNYVCDSFIGIKCFFSDIIANYLNYPLFFYFALFLSWYCLIVN